MAQLSLFSADLTPPMLADLGGLLAAHGQLVRTATGVRMSVLSDDEWRVLALRRELRVRDVDAELRPVDDGGWLLASERTITLDELYRDWSRGAVKAVPDGLAPAAGLLRCWVIAAGRATETGFVLGLDPRAPDTYEPLAAALARAGMAPAIVGPRADGPGLRVVGHRRLSRLAELVGTPPPEAPRTAFPPTAG